MHYSLNVYHMTGFVQKNSSFHLAI